MDKLANKLSRAEYYYEYLVKGVFQPGNAVKHPGIRSSALPVPQEMLTLHSLRSRSWGALEGQQRGTREVRATFFIFYPSLALFRDIFPGWNKPVGSDHIKQYCGHVEDHNFYSSKLHFEET